MATTTPEPFLNLKEVYDRTEQFWTKPLQTLFGTESFVAGMSATREGVLHQQKASRELLERHWDTLRLPTKTDHARLAAQVVTLENKVEGLADQLESLESKLDAVLINLAALSERLGQAETAKARSKQAV
jgi:polyhydroxyalkanoic acid synthase PhaR subunit